MAEFHRFECEKCGYSIQTARDGQYALFTGEYRTYLCKTCRDIVSVNETMAKDPESLSTCPECGHAGLIPWNPVTGVCPKCGGHMKETDDPIMFAD